MAAPNRFVKLADLQAHYHRARHTAAREDLRNYLLGGTKPSGANFASVSMALFVADQVDKHGLADDWLTGATIQERARLFSEIATARINTRRRR